MDSKTKVVGWQVAFKDPTHYSTFMCELPLLHGDQNKGIEAHPYTTILKSFPIMSDVMACTLIGAIGDVERFSNYLEFKKYLGVALRSPCKWQ